MIKIDSNVPLLEKVRQNPQINSFALSGVLRANHPDFKGHVQISSRDNYQFSFKAEGNEPAQVKIIYISPFGGFWSDLFASIKRIFIGSIFCSPLNQADLFAYLQEGRRITIFYSLNTSQAEAYIEESRASLPSRLHNAVFS